MNDYNNLPSASSQAAAPMSFDMGLPPLDQSFSLGKGHKKYKKSKKKHLRKELQITQTKLLRQSYELGRVRQENDLLRRMSDLAVASNRRRLDTNVIETTFKVLDK